MALEPTLTIYIPTFNRAEFLDCCLADVAANSPQLPFDFEVVISDNASTDETPDVVDSYRTRLPIRYVRQRENIGGIANMLLGRSLAQGEFFVYLADDDLLHFPGLVSGVELLRKDSKIGALFAPWIVYDRVNDTETGTFNAHKRERRIDRGRLDKLARFVATTAVNPETGIYRTDTVRRCLTAGSDDVYWSFPILVANLMTADLLFSATPFYKYVSLYFPGDPHRREHDGDSEEGWDRFLGGLDYLYARARPQLNPLSSWWFRMRRDAWIRSYQHGAVAARIRHRASAIDTYYAAKRFTARGLKLERGAGARFIQTVQVKLLKYHFDALPPSSEINLAAQAEHVAQRLSSLVDRVVIVGDANPSLVEAIRAQVSVPFAMRDKVAPSPGTGFLVAGELSDYILDWPALIESGCPIIATADLVRQYA